MRFRRFATLVLGCSALFLSGTAFAECTKDTDCKGTRICENAVCVTPPDPAVSPAVEPAPPRVEPPPSRVESPKEESEPKPPATVRRSPGLMASGIVLVSLGGLAGLIAVISFTFGGACDDDPLTSDDCDEIDSVALRSTIAFVILEGAGIPMLVYGAKRVPAEPPRAHLQVSPWGSPNAGGLRLSGSF